MLLPFMEESSSTSEFDFKKPIYDPVNAAVREKHIQTLLCPTDDVSPSGFVEMGDERYAMACYVANFGTPDLDEDQEQELSDAGRSLGAVLSQQPHQVKRNHRRAIAHADGR